MVKQSPVLLNEVRESASIERERQSGLKRPLIAIELFLKRFQRDSILPTGFWAVMIVVMAFAYPIIFDLTSVFAWLVKYKDAFFALTPVLGLIGLFVSHRLEVTEKRQADMDAWWENFILTEGLEPIMEFLQSVQNYYEPVPQIHDEVEMLPVPTHAILRVVQFLGLTSIGAYCKMCKFSPNYPKAQEAVKERHSRVLSAITVLYAVTLDVKLQDRSQVLLVRNLASMRRAIKLLNDAGSLIVSEEDAKNQIVTSGRQRNNEN